MRITDQWNANPSWPVEQQQLFQRLKNRFELQLGLLDEQPKAGPSPSEERQILERIGDRVGQRRSA